MMTYMFEMPEYIVRVNLLNMKHNCHKPWQEHSHCLTSCFGLMTDSTVIDSALVDAALRKSQSWTNSLQFHRRLFQHMSQKKQLFPATPLFSL
jgi:hypothetical protein